MKAGVVVANEKVSYMDIDMPKMGDDDILVKVKVCGICGSDVPRVWKNGVHFYPIVLGHEFSGEVVDMGKNVTEFSIGDRVSGVPLEPCMQCEDCKNGNFSLCKHYTFIGSRINGAFAEYIALPKTNAIKFDKSVSYDMGAFFEPSTIGLHGVRLSKFTANKSVAIVGAGTIGIFTAQWAKILGAKSVTIFDISEERLAIGRELGFNAINSANLDIDEVNKITNSRGFDYVYETCGQPVTTKLAFSIIGNKGTLCLIGTPTREETFTIKEWETINRKEMTIVGSWMSYSENFPGDEWRMTAKYFANNQLKLPEKFIFKKFDLSRIQEAFDLYKDPKQVKGKIFITIGEQE